jgi:F0F1-type ATP synthase membrane subunit b/b'
VRAKEEIGQVINQERAKMQVEKSQVLKEIKKDIAGLVAESLEKILEKKMDKKEDSDLIKKILK